MKIIDNCWNNIYVSSAIFGDHHFNKHVSEIYVKEGIHLYPERTSLEVTEKQLYEEEKEFLYLGACKLVFHNVCRVHFRITPIIEKSEHKKESIEQYYVFCKNNNLMNDFSFGVNFRMSNDDFLLSYFYMISAEKFSLHVLED
ncbi:hypothetical protein [Comamonas odontotermitis]|uniref:hypothetical protein n=1 Tax=Comamonas odontotermitis TaxID=379895 RepID=UPI001CC41D1E|nr:hypothetical protein [Comamonas odontotermitis]UBB16080.1 hypothetical protein LAD35_14745 [Comamonas odontotermitis]